MNTLGKAIWQETPQAIARMIPLGENFYRVVEGFYKNLRERKARRRMHPRYKGWSARRPKRLMPPPQMIAVAVGQMPSVRRTLALAAVIG
jgi:hypothetical protein